MLKSQIFGKSCFHVLMEENIRQRSLPEASDDNDGFEDNDNYDYNKTGSATLDSDADMTIYI